MKRKKERLSIEKALGEWVRCKSKREVLEILCQNGVPCGAVLDSLEIGQDPHLHARKMIVEIQHHQWGRIRVLGCPVKFPDLDAGVETSPRLGQHNREVFSGLLGLSEKDLRDLYEKGAA